MKLRIDDLENRMRTHDATTRAILGRIMSRAFARLLLAALTVSSLALTSCGPSSITAPPLIDPTKPKDAFEGIQCSAIRPPTEPDLMGWDPGSRLNLSRLQHSGVVGVRYKAEGCNVELEVLNCVGKGPKFVFSAYSATDTKIAKSQRDLFAELPIGAAKFGGKVGGGKALRTDYMLAGMLATDVMESFPVDQLVGDCKRATHVVTRMYVGGFAMDAGETEKLSAEVSVFGIGGGGSQDRTGARIAVEGNPESCLKAQKEGTQEVGCSVPLRIGLTPIEGRAEGSCPTGSDWNGSACIQASKVGSGSSAEPARVDPKVAPTAGSCPVGMASISGGSFKMGERGDSVTVAAYCLDLTEVTVSAYTSCTKSGGCSSEDVGSKDACNWGVSGRENHPMNCVDWGQAATFCKAQGKHLPSEEEWEWAARGGNEGRTYPWGNAEPDFQACWSGVSKRSGTCPVGGVAEGNNRWGVKDLAGNVWEWTRTKYDATGPARVIRGGGWADDDPRDLRASFRFLGHPPSSRLVPLGFRCAR